MTTNDIVASYLTKKNTYMTLTDDVALMDDVTTQYCTEKLTFVLISNVAVY